MKDEAQTPPPPSQPGVSLGELPAKWRARAAETCTPDSLLSCADELESALRAHSPTEADKGSSISEAFEAWWEADQGDEFSLTTKNCANAAWHAAFRVGRPAASGQGFVSVPRADLEWWARESYSSVVCRQITALLAAAPGAGEQT